MKTIQLDYADIYNLKRIITHYIDDMTAQMEEARKGAEEQGLFPEEVTAAYQSEIEDAEQVYKEIDRQA